MSRPMKARRFFDKADSGNSDMSHDSLMNLVNILEKYRLIIQNPKFRNTGLSINATIVEYINQVLSEYGEESIKKQKGVSVAKEGSDINDGSSLHQNWTHIVKLSQEIVTSNKDPTKEVVESILLMISQILERQSLRITSPTILQDVIIKWIAHLNIVNQTIKPIYVRCLSSFILGNLSAIPKEIFANLSQTFFRISEKYLSNDNNQISVENLDCLKYCISGLTNLCYIPPKSSDNNLINSNAPEDFLSKRFQICGRFLQIFIDCLEKSLTFCELTTISLYRMQHQCLHGLNYVCQRPHGLSLENLERLLLVLKIYCGYGLFRITKFDTSSTTGSFMTENDETNMANSGFNVDYSTEDFGTTSDGNNSVVVPSHGRPMKKWEKKTRKLSMELLLKILEKTCRKISTSVWTHFMPTNSGCLGRRHFNLVNLLDKEDDLYGKSLVLSAIQQCVENCREFLSTAQYQSGPAAFISKSHTLAVVLFMLHERLLAILVGEKSEKIRIAVLKSLSALIRSVLYHRLKIGLIALIVRSLRQIFLETDNEQTQLRCAVLDTFASLVNLESVSSEMRRLLLQPPKLGDLFSDISGSTTTSSLPLFLGDGDTDKCSRPSWLVQLCVRLAHPSLVNHLWTEELTPESWASDDMDDLVAKIFREKELQVDVDIRCQALTTVGAMLSQHSSLIRPSLNTLKKTLLACLGESLQFPSDQSNASLRSQVLRVFSGFLTTLENKKAKRYLGIVQDSEIVDDMTADVWTHSFFSTSSSVEVAREWWTYFLLPVVKCLKDENENVRRSAAQCMSLISESVLEFSMTSDERYSYWSLLLSMFCDTSLAVSCQSIWALGYWVAMRPLNTDLNFINNLVGMCVKLSEAAIEDSSAYIICANAVWTLSNVVEVLVAHKESLLSCCRPDNPDGSCEALLHQYLGDTDRIGQLIHLFCKLCSLKKAGQVGASARIYENAIRGLGFLCRFVHKTMLNSDCIREELQNASETFCKAIQLPDKAGRVKVKWNACLSVSHVCRNQVLIYDPTIFQLDKLIDTLVGTVSGDRYFKVRNNSLMSLLVLIEVGAMTPTIQHLLLRLLFPLCDACISVSQKSTVPFSEVHRHCLCMYLLDIAILKLLALINPSNIHILSVSSNCVGSDFRNKLSVISHEHLPLIWQHLQHLNRSFNKQALLTKTLMLNPPVSVSKQEVDLLLLQLSETLKTVHSFEASTINDYDVTVDMLDVLYLSLANARPSDEECTLPESFDNAQYPSDNCSDDDGLLTRRSGTSLIFSQIYD